MQGGYHLRPGQSLALGTSPRGDHPCFGNIPALPLPLSHFALPAAARPPAARKAPVMLHASGRWLPAPWGRCPPAWGAHGSPGALVLLEHPWPWELLSLWPGHRPPWGGGSRRGGHGVGRALWGRGRPSVLWSRAEESPQQQGLWQRQTQGCFVQKPLVFGVVGLGLFFFWMYIKVFVWSPPVVLDWVSHWHRPARRRESVPGSAPLPRLGTVGHEGGSCLSPAEPRGIYWDISDQGPPTPCYPWYLEHGSPGDA